MTRYAKALAAFFTTTAGVVAGLALHPDWRAVLIGLCTIGGAVAAVYLTPNDPPKGEPADPTMSERGPVRDPKGRFAKQSGQIGLGELLLVLVLVVVLLILLGVIPVR